MNSFNQGRPRDDFGCWGVIAADVGLGDGEETRVDVSDDGVLAPSSPIAAAPDELRSVMIDSKVFCSMSSAQSRFISPCRARTAEGMTYQNGGPGLVSTENGFAFSEKGMRNGEGLDMPVGNHGGEAFSKTLFQDCPEAPLRKRIRVCQKELDGLDGERKETDRVKESEGYSLMGAETMKLDERKMFNSVEQGGLPARLPPTPLRTEDNGDGGDAAGRVLQGGDVEMSPESLRESTEEDASGYRSSAPVEEETTAAATEVTDMDVDVSSSENLVAEVTISPAAEEQTGEIPVSQRDSQADNLRAQMFADLFEEKKKVGSSSTDHLGQSGSMGVHPPPVNHERSRGDSQNDIPQVRRSAEVIEFDDSDDEPAETNVHESDDSSTKGKKPISQLAGQQRRSGYKLSSSDSTAASFNPDDDSDSDDCMVVGSWRPPYVHRNCSANPVIVEENEDTDSTSDNSDSSDVEEVGGSQSAIRRMWEEAAMKRRIGRAMRNEGSKANGEHGGTINLDDDSTESQGLAESVATSVYHDSPDSKDQTEICKALGGGLEGVPNGPGGRQGTSSRCPGEERPVGQSPRDDVISSSYNETDEILVASADSGVPGISSPGTDQGYIDMQKLADVAIPGGTELDRVDSQTAGGHSESLNEPSASGADQVHEGFRNEMEQKQQGSVVGGEAGTSTGNEDLLAAKDRLKQTLHYRKTDEAEWSSCQLEIERQADETKRLRQRKRREADRKKEVERKQKERIEELRLRQMEEERNMGLREQLRSEVRVELERIASNCYDFATLLRQLGIPVEGGSRPSTLQVNAAYKKALFTFHPDSAIQGDPRHQVECEEKFKLILRLKNTLVPVAIDYTHAFRSF